MKKFLYLLLTFTLATLIVGCSSTPSSNQSADSKSGQVNSKAKSDISGTVKVALAGWQLENGLDPITGKNTIGLNEYLNETFKKEYPNIKLEITQIPWDNAQAKQKAMLLSNDADVIYTGGAWAAQFYQQGLVRGIDDLIKNDPNFKPDEYLKGLWNSPNAKSADGVQFGIPVVLGKRVIAYDKKIFDDWGVKYLSDKPTPQEILEKAKEMTGINPKTGKQNYGVWWCGKCANQSEFVGLTYAFNSEGGKGNFNNPKDIKWELNTPEMKNALEWISKAAKYNPPGFVNGQGVENFGLQNNNVAIAIDIDGNVALSQFKSSGDKNLLNRFVPVMNDGPNGSGWVAVDPFIMAKNTKNVKAAWEVMKFLTNHDTQKWNYENFNITPTLKDVDFLAPEDKFSEKAMQIAEVSKSTLMDEKDPFYSSEIAPSVSEFASKAANGQTPDITALLNNLQKKAEEFSANQK